MAKLKTIIHTDPASVSERLAELGLSEPALLHAAQRWYLTWTGFTANHPPIGIGISAWTEAVAALREQLLPTGWARSDEKNYSLVKSPDGKIAINIATGDSGTGRSDLVPSNKAPKGNTTAEAISVNNQQLEFDLPVPDLPHVRGEPGVLTWFLLLHRTRGEIRCELSLPSQMSADGQITRWQERIILTATPLDEKVEIDPSQAPDVHIDVKRRA
jgi:hypothetical protein